MKFAINSGPMPSPSTKPVRSEKPDVDLRGAFAKKVIALLVDTLINVATDMVSADDVDDITMTFTDAVEGNDQIPWP